MSISLENKLNAMFWDLPVATRNKMVAKIISDPAGAFRDEHILLRVLDTLSWYELIQLAGSDQLLKLLDDVTINRLFPDGRRTYYTHAKRLLSKYTLSASG